MRHFSSLLGFVAIFLATAGCTGSGGSSSSSGGQVAPPAPCGAAQLTLSSCDGGTLVGTWGLSCFGPAGLGITISPAAGQRYLFNGDGTFTRSGSGPDYVVHAPAAAFQADGGLAEPDCEALSVNAATFGGSCATVAGECDCTYPSSGLNESGQWSQAPGGWVSITEGVYTTQVFPCVNGNALKLLAHFGNFAVDGLFLRQ